MNTKKRGLSLVEVLVALVLLSVAGLVLMGVLPSVIVMGRGSQMQSVALADARVLLQDALRTDQYTGPQATYNIGTSPPPAPAPPLEVLPGGSATVLEVADPNRPGVYDVTVTVTWIQEGGLNRTVQLGSAFAPPGLASVPCPTPTATPTPTPPHTPTPARTPTPTPSPTPKKSPTPTPSPTPKPTPTPTPSPTPIQVFQPYSRLAVRP